MKTQEQEKIRNKQTKNLLSSNMKIAKNVKKYIEEQNIFDLHFTLCPFHHAMCHTNIYNLVSFD